ncbi:MAG: SLC13 family permease, partial [Cyclobacteriaceae bacterium]|nr:SLC13 family permease [Cyclobacteriaceae bacterium HetDA_MAG_MS6]
MSIDAIIVIAIISAGVILFVTEWLSIDLVAILIMVALVITGVLTAEEGLAGFSNSATITVAFMFVLSTALLKTGSLQRIGPFLGNIFKTNFNIGLLLTILFVGGISAFVNNTPIVAMFIPVVISVASQSGVSPSKLLIPLSYASILGGTCTLIGTSTNILVSGIAEEHGLPGFHMFLSSPIGLIYLIIGTAFLFLVGKRILPNRIDEDGLRKQFAARDYLTEIEVLQGSSLDNKTIMSSVLVKDLEVDIIELRRKESVFTLPPGDFILKKGDILKVRCNVEKIKEIKDKLRFNEIKINENNFAKGSTTVLELILSKGSEFEGKTLREMDFRRRYRAVPLAIMHREEVRNEKIHDIRLEAGDIVLTEIKSHRVDNIKREEMNPRSPFIILSEEGIIDFDRRKFSIVLAVIAGVVGLAAFNLLPIVVSVILGTAILVATSCLNMKELYASIDWKIVFLLAGALSMGAAMQKTGLAIILADVLIENLGVWGPIAVLSGLYITTSLLTE